MKDRKKFSNKKIITEDGYGGAKGVEYKHEAESVSDAMRQGDPDFVYGRRAFEVFGQHPDREKKVVPIDPAHDIMEHPVRGRPRYLIVQFSRLRFSERVQKPAASARDDKMLLCCRVDKMLEGVCVPAEKDPGF